VFVPVHEAVAQAPPRPTVSLAILPPPDAAVAQGNLTTGDVQVQLMIKNMVCEQVSNLPVSLSLPTPIPGVSANLSPSTVQFAIQPGAYGDEGTPGVNHYMTSVKAHLTVLVTNASEAMAFAKSGAASMSGMSGMDGMSGMSGMGDQGSSASASAKTANVSAGSPAPPIPLVIHGHAPAPMCQGAGNVPDANANGAQNLTIASPTQAPALHTSAGGGSRIPALPASLVLGCAALSAIFLRARRRA
jgi:hypothetical protein